MVNASSQAMGSLSTRHDRCRIEIGSQLWEVRCSLSSQLDCKTSFTCPKLHEQSNKRLLRSGQRWSKVCLAEGGHFLPEGVVGSGGR